MTREEYISKLEEEQAFLYFHLKPMDEKQHNKWINHIFFLIKQSANQVFDDHEAEIKLASDVYSTDKMHMYQELKAKNEEIERLKEAMQEFVNRCEKGEAVRSRNTYYKFKELLKDDK